MAFSSGKSTITIEDIANKVSEIEILNFYLGVKDIPTIIRSPLREDNNPSFGLYSLNGSKIHFKDLATKESGGIYDLLSKMWDTDLITTLERINKDIPKFNIINKTQTNNLQIKSTEVYNSNTDLLCKIRDWEFYDIEFWKSYGITIEWLKFADVYPISHKIIIKNNKKYIFKADKYAYAYVERKEGKITLKIYQPYNTNGYKWSNKNDYSVISLWTKIPETGNKVCICASLKDALCLWANTGIPSIAIQGEGYNISQTANNNLSSRFKNIYILLDNDEEGLKDGISLAEKTGFKNLVLPNIDNKKDVSDLYKSLKNKEDFKKIIVPLFNN